MILDDNETRALGSLPGLPIATPLDPSEFEARVIGAIIARPWLITHEVLTGGDFADQRNRDVLAAILDVSTTHGPLPEAAVDMGLAVMRRIDGTPAADRVDLTYVASLALIAELALGPVDARTHVLDWFDGEIEAMRARRAA